MFGESLRSDCRFLFGRTVSPCETISNVCVVHMWASGTSHLRTRATRVPSGIMAAWHLCGLVNGIRGNCIEDDSRIESDDAPLVRIREWNLLKCDLCHLENRIS
jgi:hypothetical protein